MRTLSSFAAAAGAVALRSLARHSARAAQWIVFDPNNYAQNVLTAARALQQINNQITSLQNQAQMLINQAKKPREPAVFVAAAASAVDPADPATSGPGPAHCLRCPADRPAFSTSYAPASGSQYGSGADHKRAIALAEFGRGATGRAAGSGRRRRQSRHQPHRRCPRLSPRARAPPARCRQPKPAISSSLFRRSNSPISRPPWRRRAGRRALKRRSARPRKTRAGSNSDGF